MRCSIPANVTWRFVALDEEIGPPLVQLHDLRHGAATPAHAALAIAETAARLVPRARAASEDSAPEAESEPDNP